MEKRLVSPIIICLLLLLELVLLIIFTLPEFQGDNYSQWKSIRKVIWRIVLLLPLFSIIITALIKSPSPGRLFPLLLLIGFGVILVADSVIIFNFPAGMALFLVFHILQIVNFLIMNRKTSAFSIGYLIFLLALSAGMFALVILQIKDTLVIKIAMSVYFLTFVASIWRAGSLLTAINRGFVICLSLGLYLFLACDTEIIVAAYMKVIIIKGVNVSQILNNLFYYSGLSLIALASIIHLYQPEGASSPAKSPARSD